jgi:hypothetical protein
VPAWLRITERTVVGAGAQQDFAVSDETPPARRRIVKGQLKGYG